MKRVAALSIIILALVLNSAVLWAANAPGAVIIAPPAGSTQIRNGFPCTVSIRDYTGDQAAGWHYWVTLADVKPDNSLNLHWPKFYVESGNYTDTIIDGGTYPLPTPQPMVILLLKVDAATNAQLTQWILNGRQTGNYPGLPIVTSQMTDQRPIFLRKR
jgi:hypothetical protein